MKGHDRQGVMFATLSPDWQRPSTGFLALFLFGGQMH